MHSMLYYSDRSDSSQNIAHGVMKCFPSQHVTMSSSCQFIVQDVLIEKKWKVTSTMREHKNYFKWIIDQCIK